MVVKNTPMKRGALWLVVGAVICGSPTWAQDDGSAAERDTAVEPPDRTEAPSSAAGERDESSVMFPETLVTERRKEDGWLTGTIDRLRRIDPITGITRQQFEDRPDTRRLGDVINRLPSVFMGGPPGENKDIRLRGLDKEFTRFELDGVQLPGGGEKREFQVNRIAPFAVGEVSILRNSTPEFESDGIAGRVTADLRDVPAIGDPFRFDLLGSVGGVDSFDAEHRRVSLGLGVRPAERFGANLFFDAQRNPLKKDKVKRKFKADGSLKELEIEDEEKPTESYNLLADLVLFYESGEIHLKPTFFYLDEDKDKEKTKIKDNGDVELELEDEEKIQDTHGVALEHEHRFGSGWKLWSQVDYFSTGERKSKNKLKFKNGTFDKREVEDEDKEDEFWQGRAKVTVPVELLLPQTLKAGVHVRLRDRFRSKEKIELKPGDPPKDKTGPKDNYDLEETYVAFFIQDEFRVGERLSVLPGVRVENVELDSRSGDGTERTETFLDINPSLHARYALSDQWSIQGAVSRKVNRPKFDEIAPFTEEKGDRFVEGNPNLDPARSWGVDIGTTYETEDLLFGINFFHKKVRGVIEESDTGVDRGGKDVFRVENVGDGWTRGLELEQRVHLGMFDQRLTGLEIWANESLFDSELEDQAGRVRQFNEQPDWLANFGVDYTYEPTGTTLTVAMKYIDELKKFKKEGEREIEDGRFTLDVGFRQRLAENVQLTFDAINLLDTKKEKVKFKGGEVEREEESTGRLFVLGIEATF